MSVVYRVRAPDRGGEAALKLLAKADAEAFARFERERRLLGALGEEQGFVGILDAGISAGAAWILMPLVVGGTLRQRLLRGPLGIEETVALGIRLARALGAAHERGIVHRDVKPENVLFTTSGRVLLADLGLAKHFDRDAKGASQSLNLSSQGTFKGTAGYMAPEQVADAASAGPAADVFALGAVLHECLSGLPAIRGENLLEVLASLTSGKIERIGRKGVPPWLEAVVVRALAREPRDRFADGTRLAVALESRRGATPTRRRRAVLVALSLGALVSGTALAVQLSRSSSPETRPSRDPPALSARQLAERGEEARRRGDLNGAIVDATKAIALDPRLATAWSNRSLARLDMGDARAALADAARAIELDSRLAVAWSRRAAARLSLHDWDGAIDDASRAIDLDPGLSAAWSFRSVARKVKGDTKGALQDATRSVELDGTRANAWSSRGTARFELGDVAGAIADYTKVIELDPLGPQGWHNRGQARSASGDNEGAKSDFTRAIELDPGDAVAWAGRGRARLMTGDHGGAIDDYTRANALRPDDADTIENLGIARMNSGDQDGAFADLTRAIELQPRNASAWMNRGTVRINKGDIPGALADLERALAIAPEGPDAPRTRLLIEQARARAR
jgi:tetratricopeptide (TPR) repeat protein